MSTTDANESSGLPRAVSNLYQLKAVLANERAVAAGIVSADKVVLPDRSSQAFDRLRPVLGGCAVGPKGTGYGTLGVPARVESLDDLPGWAVWADDVQEGDLVLTTNRHVLDGDLGQEAFQPGHKTNPNNRIGELVGYGKLGWPAAPDVAFIRLDEDVEFGGYLVGPDDVLFGESVHRGDLDDLVGETCRLTGATSGVAEADVQAADQECVISYGGVFGDQEKRNLLKTGDNSQGGDSGSPTDVNGALVANNFASSGGFQSGGRAWKATVPAIEEAGVRVLANHEWGQSSPTMRDLEIDGTESRNGRAWYYFDVTGDAQLGDHANETERVGESPANAEHTRIGGRVASGVDTFRFSGDVEDANFKGAWQGIEVRIDGQAIAPVVLPGFNGGGSGGGGQESDPPSDYPTPPKSQGIPHYRLKDTRWHAKKPTYTTEGGTIYIHPDGSADAAGTRDDPLDSLNAADALAGTLNLHDIEIRILDDIVLDESPMMGPYIGTMVKAGGVSITGQGEDRVRVETTNTPGFLTLGALGLNPIEMIHLENLDLHTQLQVYGTAFVENCTLRPTAHPTNGHRHNRCLAGYNNYVRVQESTFTDNPADLALDAKYGVACKDNATYHLFGNTFETSKAAVKFYGGGGEVVPFGANDVSEPEHGWQIEGDQPEAL